MKQQFLYIIVCIAFATVGCQRAANADRDAALDAVRRNLQFMQEKKIEEMMATIHPQSPSFAGTRIAMESLKDFDLKCELASLEVVSSRPDEIRVRFDQKTEKKKGAEKAPTTQVVGIHTLKKDGNVWKLFGTEVISTEVLDTPPEPTEPPDAAKGQQ
jgi:hypothetical protein